MKKVLSYILLIGICLNSLISCGEQNVNEIPSDSSVQADEKIDYLDTLPQTKFNGQTYRMLGVDFATRRNFPNEEEIGDTVNDALYKRNSTISERYDVTIESFTTDDVKATARQTVLANDNEYDILIGDIADIMVSMMREKLLLDINSLPYIDTDAAWWSADMAENTTIDGKQYITIGDISPMKYYAPYVMAFNQRLADEYTNVDIPETVIAGKWTNDLLYSMIKDINNDLDGDGDIDNDDFHGYAHVESDITAFSHFAGSGQRLSSIDKNGQVTIELSNETAIDLISQLNRLLSLTSGIAPSGGDSNPTVSMFKEGRALFFGNSYSLIIATFRDMEDDFGVIPVPKYDEQQESYHSYVNTYAYCGVAFPITVENRELVGLISEAMCYTSYRYVRDALYETTMKVKISRDDSNGQILDMIFDNTYIDLNGMFNFGGSTSVLANAINKGTEFVSSYAALEEKIEADIKNLFAE